MIKVTSLILLLSGIAAGSFAYANVHHKSNNITTPNVKILNSNKETYSTSFPTIGDRDYYLNISSQHIHDLYNLLGNAPSTYHDEGRAIYDFLVDVNNKYGAYSNKFHSDLGVYRDDYSLFLMLAQVNPHIESGGFNISALLFNLDKMENDGPGLSISGHLHVDYKPFGHDLYSMSFACHS